MGITELLVITDNFGNSLTIRGRREAYARGRAAVKNSRTLYNQTVSRPKKVKVSVYADNGKGEPVGPALKTFSTV